MNWLILLGKILPSLMALAEMLLGPKEGKQKKDMVMVAAEAIMGGISAVSTGGQAETWNRIAAPVSAIIDAAASIAFPHSKTDEVQATGTP